MPRISICIPTYNRARFLAELLDSIASQMSAEIEVIVSDDASPDNTSAVGERYYDIIGNYKFIRQPENLGLDRNFLAVVEAASGEYIWLMGDDDRVEPGGIKRVLEALDRWPSVAGLTLGVIDYDVEMRSAVGIRSTPPTQLLNGSSEVFGNIAELLGFMSALVINREKWRQIAREPSVENFQNYYVQVYIIGRVLERFGLWGVVQEPCVGFRTGNDQFKTKFGWLQRLKIDVAGYSQIANALFADDPETLKRVRRRIFTTHVMGRIHNAKTASGGASSITKAAGYLISEYYDLPECWLRALPTLFAPSWSIRKAREIYKRYAPNSGAARAREIA